MMHVRKSVLAVLLMTIATSASIGVYAMTNYTNVLLFLECYCAEY